MSATFTTANDVLKEDYKAPLREQINQGCFILSQLEKNTEDVQGLRAYLTLHVNRSSGVGARGENGTLPTAGAQGYKRILTPLRFNYGRIQVSGPLISAMASDKGAFIRAIKSETDGIMNDLKIDVNRQCHGTSNGVIATCGTTSSATTVVLLTPSDTQMRQLYNDGGMVVDIGTVASPTAVASARTVTAYDLAAGTIDISGAAVSTTSGTHFVFRTSAGGATDNSGAPGGQDGQYELTGLQTIVSATSTLFTVAPASYPTWTSTVDSNSGLNRAISENLVNKTIMDTEIASGKQVNLLVGNAGVSRAASNLLEAKRRNMDTVDLKAGYSGIQWTTPMEGLNGTKARALVWDRQAKENRLYGLCTDELVEFVGSDWDWMDQDGAVLSRVSGVDAYEATMFKYNEIGCSQRNAHFAIDDITQV